MPDTLLTLLHEVAHLSRTRADRLARAQGMSRAQWIALVKLRQRDGMTQRDLAELLEVEPISAGRLVDRLAARGLIERRADPADRRIWRLHLTPAAAPVLAEIEAVRAAFSAEALQGIDPALCEAAAAALQAMKANLLAAEPETGTAA
ncbi:MarR family transcriptional regulator [Siccirubricoccus sp. KC 17139]|uniref:MarR family transcriptional regulator n=1 Tax=Siccirubricoccus soli TaxID=2899147 RepID=A0ABT1D1D0_9PROT|nr:MarR family transcriptional regulator [Siccirubricoccus soli]MCO6415713.1 MarR family transcriptional regulator [Siccirubricoccus soli]MCP2681845.1 MarR family transcriptional regulator [Siccirubricoccus soli]